MIRHDPDDKKQSIYKLLHKIFRWALICRYNQDLPSHPNDPELYSHKPPRAINKPADPAEYYKPSNYFKDRVAPRRNPRRKSRRR